MAYVDLSKCNLPNKYVVYPERPAHHEFTAWNDYEAFQKAKKLCDSDPSFTDNLYRITADDRFEKVKPSPVFKVTRINAENTEGINTFQLNDYDFCCPKVRKNAVIYDFSDDDLDENYLDGRAVYEGREYTAVSLDLTEDPDDEEWEFLGYVDSHDVKNN